MPAVPSATGRNAAPGDRRLTSVLRDQYDEANTSDYRVGNQRERNYRYYTLQKLGNEIAGRSQYISPDVFDVVESKKAYFKEVFLSARQPIRFVAEGNVSQEMADARTGYVRKQLRLNNYGELFRDAWHDAFVAKRCAILAEWKQDSEDYEQQVQAAPIMQLQQQLQQDPDIVDVDTSQMQQFIDNRTGMPMAQGTMTITRDTSRVDLSLLQPERYYRDPTVTYIRDATYAGYEEDLPRGELIDRGYDPEQIENLSMEWEYRNSQEDNSRKWHDSSWTRRRLHNRPKETETLLFRRTWAYLDLSQHMDLGQEFSKGDNTLNLETMRLWEIHWCDREILRKADGSVCIYPADSIPIFEWTEYKISHADNGMATADIVAHTQKTNSTLKRLIIDNQQMRNTSRYEAVIGAIKNPRELLDNNIGGVIWSRSPGSVAPLNAPELSPMSLSVIEMLDQDKEERSGVSRLAQGLNTDVVRYQNAADMVEKLTVNANRRITQAARDFAENLFVPLAQYMFALAVKNDTRMHSLEVAGKQVQISPAQWDESETGMVVHVALTPEEAMKHAQTLLMMHGVQSQDPQLSQLYGIRQRHALMDDVYDSLGVADASRYLMRPDSPEFMKQMQITMQEAEMNKQLELKSRQLQLGLAQSADTREWQRVGLEGFRTQVDTANIASDNLREDEKFEHDKVIDFNKARQDQQEFKLDVAEFDFDKVLKSAEFQLEKQQKRSVKLGP